MCTDVRILVRFNYRSKLCVSYIRSVYESVLMDMGGKTANRGFRVIVWKGKIRFLGRFSIQSEIPSETFSKI